MTLMTRLAPRASHLALAALLGTLWLGFYPQWTQLSDLWTHEIGSAHGWLVLGLCLLCARDLGHLPLARIASARLPPLLSALAFYASASAAHIDLAEDLAIPLTALALTYALFGGPGVRAVRFACVYFLFALPLWTLVLSPLQHLTVWAVSHVLPLFGIASHGEGILIIIPGASFEVSEGCAGSHFLIVALAISALTSRFWALPRVRALACLMLAACFALLANWVRVLFIIWRAYMTDMHTSLVRDHYWFGWGVFAGTLVLYFMIARRLDTGATRVVHTEEGPSPAGLGQAGKVIAVLSVTLLALLGVQRRESLAAESVGSLAVHAALPSTWSGPRYTTSSWQPVFPGASDSDLVTYSGANTEVSWYRVLYARERTGAKLTGYGTSIVPTNWRLFKQQRVRVPKTTPYTQEPEWVLETQAVDTEGQLHLIWSWYAWDGEPLSRAWELKLKQALSAFEWTRPHQATLEAFETTCTPSCTSAQDLLERFVRDRMSSGTP